MAVLQKPRLKTILWIAGALIVVLLLGKGYFFLAEMREVAQFSDMSNRVLTVTRGLTKLSELRAMTPADPTIAQIHPGLSWRVAILPFMDEAQLYNEFHLDEPWDSPHNKQLISRMPSDFAPIGWSLEPGLTCMVMPVEAQATNDLFAQLPPKSWEAFSKLLERVGSVGRVVEVPPELAVIWTKPDELSITDPKITAYRKRLLVGLVDGSVSSVAADEVTPAKLKAMFTPPPED